jgi:hypothetical protein
MAPLSDALPRSTSTPQTTPEETSFHNADAVPIAVRRAAIRGYFKEIPAGVEDTEWGQLTWELYGKPNGTIDFKRPNEMPEEQLNAIMVKCIEISKKWPQPPLPVLNWKWPVSHVERIQELELLLQEPSFEKQHANIRTAIEWHRTMPPDEHCSREYTYFCGGSKVDRKETRGLISWCEGAGQQYMMGGGYGGGNRPLGGIAALPDDTTVMQYTTGSTWLTNRIPHGTAGYPWDQTIHMVKVDANLQSILLAYSVL